MSGNTGGPNYWATVAPHVKLPSGPPHPGPAYVSGGANPCKGPDGYNWLDNAPGVRLPPGCVRPASPGFPMTITRVDPNYEILPQSHQRPAPTPPAAEITRQQTPLPAGQIATGTDSAKTVTSKVDPSYEILPRNNQVVAPTPPDGAQTSINRLPDPPAGQMATGRGPAYHLGLPVDQNIRKPPMPVAGPIATGN
jgi:hypothetical protein